MIVYLCLHLTLEIPFSLIVESVGEKNELTFEVNFLQRGMVKSEQIVVVTSGKIPLGMVL